MSNLEFFKKQAKNFLKDWQTQTITTNTDGSKSYHYDWKFYDVDYHFTSPLPEAFDLKNFYKEDYFNAAPYIDVMIYFNRLRHCTYPRFVKEMNLMLGYFHQAIKMTIP